MTTVEELPELDRELLIRVLDHLCDHPEQHDQEIYLAPDEHCGTVGCVAGWIVTLSGHQQDVLSHYRPPAGGWESTAQWLAGLTNAEAAHLFSSFTSAVASRKFLARLIDGKRLLL